MHKLVVHAFFWGRALPPQHLGLRIKAAMKCYYPLPLPLFHCEYAAVPVLPCNTLLQLCCQTLLGVSQQVFDTGDYLMPAKKPIWPVILRNHVTKLHIQAFISWAKMQKFLTVYSVNSIYLIVAIHLLMGVSHQDLITPVPHCLPSLPIHFQVQYYMLV